MGIYDAGLNVKVDIYDAGFKWKIDIYDIDLVKTLLLKLTFASVAWQGGWIRI